MTIVYIRSDAVLGVIIKQYKECAEVAWYIDGIKWISVLEEDEYIVLSQEDLND